MIILANEKGDVAAFYSCNFNSTNYKGKYKDSEPALTGEGGDIADGTYVINYGYHKNYAALWVNNNGVVDSMTYNPTNRNFTIKGIHIHKGGDDWSWSTGCITIHQGDWDGFMSYFNKNNPTYSYVTNELGEKIGIGYSYEGKNIKGTLNGQIAGTLTINSI